MTDTPIVLHYRQTAKAQARALDKLAARAQAGGILQTLLAGRHAAMVWNLAILAALVYMTLGFLPLIEAQGWSVLTAPEYLVGNLVYLALALGLLQSVWVFLARRLRRIGARAAGEDVLTGECRLRAAPEGVIVRLAKRTSAYKWAAFVDLAETESSLLLLLSPRDGIVVPKSAFASEADAQAFRTFVRDRITAG